MTTVVDSEYRQSVRITWTPNTIMPFQRYTGKDVGKTERGQSRQTLISEVKFD